MSMSAHHLANTPNATLAYLEAANPDAAEVVILHHGGESHKRQYVLLTPHLSGNIRAISYDQREVCHSNRSSEPYSISDLADDCVALLDALDLERAHVMGISAGGAIALHVGLRHPDRVSSLIVGAAPASFQNPNPFIARLVQLTPDERGAAMLDASLSPEAQCDKPTMALMQDLVSGRASAPGTPRLAAISSHHLTESDLASIKAPTLLVYGELDPIARPEDGRFIHANLPQSTLVISPGARHGLAFEQPETLAELVNEWVEGHPTVWR